MMTIESQQRRLAQGTGSSGFCRLDRKHEALIDNSVKSVRRSNPAASSSNRQRVICPHSGLRGSRPLTDNELARLFEIAAERGRLLWYMAAFHAGLCKGEPKRLRWRDIDFEYGSLTIPNGKAKRADTIPLHPQLAAELRRAHPLTIDPQLRVFPTTVTDITRRKDFKCAGIAEVAEHGRVADLHRLRATLATRLARAGVAPQLARRMMRHADNKTTLKHYTVLTLTDVAGAVAGLPDVMPGARDSATGTLDSL